VIKASGLDQGDGLRKRTPIPREHTVGQYRGLLRQF
jgi:hypothetical protein